MMLEQAWDVSGCGREGRERGEREEVGGKKGKGLNSGKEPRATAALLKGKPWEIQISDIFFFKRFRRNS